MFESGRLLKSNLRLSFHRFHFFARLAVVAVLVQWAILPCVCPMVLTARLFTTVAVAIGVPLPTISVVIFGVGLLFSLDFVLQIEETDDFCDHSISISLAI